MADLNDIVNEVLNIDKKLQENKVANFSYTNKAYTDNDVAGVESYDFNQEQNIPVATPEVLTTNSTILNKGFRAQSSSLPRMLVNHLFGRTSYNLNKLVDTTTIFLSGMGRHLAQNGNKYSATAQYEPNDLCFINDTIKDVSTVRYFISKYGGKGQAPLLATGKVNTDYWTEFTNINSWNLNDNAPSIPDGDDLNNYYTPGTYKNNKLSGVTNCPDEIKEAERNSNGNNSYCTIFIEAGNGWAKQFIFYVDSSTAPGNGSGHYLIIRGALLDTQGKPANWTSWTSKTQEANHLTPIGMKEIYDNLYPAGTYYWTSDEAFDPNEKWTGTWERVQDKILVAKGSKYTKNIDTSNLDGNGELKLSVAQLPSHNHGMTHNHPFSNGTTNTTGSHTHSINDPGHKHNYDISYTSGFGGRSWPGASEEASSSYTNIIKTGITINEDGSHRHTVTGTVGNSTKTLTDNRGDGNPIKPLPPIEVAYCWKRTA